jgi:DNA repair protein RadC
MAPAMTLLGPVDKIVDPSVVAGFVPGAAEDDITRHLLRPHFAADRESLLLAGFDAFDRLVRLERAGGDDARRCNIPSRCWRALLDHGVVTVLMAHNHPSNIALPSDADIATTRETALFLRVMGIELVDHRIFVASGHFSFRSAEML